MVQSWDLQDGDDGDGGTEDPLEFPESPMMRRSDGPAFFAEDKEESIPRDSNEEEDDGEDALEEEDDDDDDDEEPMVPLTEDAPVVGDASAFPLVRVA
jgi:hypothetical protein